MLVLFFVVLSMLVCIAAYMVYTKLASLNSTLIQIESEVSHDMEPRSHRLCMRACEVDSMPNIAKKIAADDQLRDDMHQYAADFEAEVAERLKNNNVTTVKAYGGIRIV